MHACVTHFYALPVNACVCQGSLVWVRSCMNMLFCANGISMSRRSLTHIHTHSLSLSVCFSVSLFLCTLHVIGMYLYPKGTRIDTCPANFTCTLGKTHVHNTKQKSHRRNRKSDLANIFCSSLQFTDQCTHPYSHTLLALSLQFTSLVYTSMHLLTYFPCSQSPVYKPTHPYSHAYPVCKQASSLRI